MTELTKVRANRTRVLPHRVSNKFQPRRRHYKGCNSFILGRIYCDSVLPCDVSFLQAAGNGYLKSSYEGEKCIEVAYIDVSVEWVSSKTAGYLIWTEAPQLLACSTRASQELFHYALISIAHFVNICIFHETFNLYACDTPAEKSGEPPAHLCRVDHSLLALYQLQIAGVAHSVQCSVIDWKNRLFQLRIILAWGKRNGCNVDLTHTFIQYSA